jgi:hypothetical protein
MTTTGETNSPFHTVIQARASEEEEEEEERKQTGASHCHPKHLAISASLTSAN